MCREPAFLKSSLGQVVCWLFFIGYFSKSLGLSYEVDTIQPLIQIRDLKLKEGRSLAWGHRGSVAGMIPFLTQMCSWEPPVSTLTCQPSKFWFSVVIEWPQFWTTALTVQCSNSFLSEAKAPEIPVSHCQCRASGGHFDSISSTGRPSWESFSWEALKLIMNDHCVFPVNQFP